MNDENLENKLDETKEAAEETVTETISNDPPIKIADTNEKPEEVKEEVVEVKEEEPKEEGPKEEPKQEEGPFGGPIKPPAEEKVEVTTPPAEEDKEKKKSKTAAIAVVCLLVILTIGIAAYLFLSQNPKTVFHKFFTTVQTNVKSNEYLKDTSKIKGHAEFTATTNLEGFDKIITDKKQIIDYGYDQNKKVLELGIAGENTNNAGLVIFVKDGKTYAKFNSQNKMTLLDNSQTFGQYAMMLEELANTESISKDDALYLIDKIISLVDTSMIDGNYSKSKETVSINSKKVHLNKFTYTVDKKVIVEQGNKILKGLKEDKKAKEIINSLLKSAEITIDDLEEAKEEDLGDVKPLKFSIFTKGFKSVFAGIKFEFEEESVLYAMNNGEYTINAKTDGANIDITSQKENGKDVIKAVAKDNDGNTMAKATATINTLTDTKLDFDYSLTFGALKANGKVSIVGDEKSSKFSISANIDKSRFTIKGNTKQVEGEVADYETTTEQLNDIEISGYGIVELQNTYLANYIVQTAAAQSALTQPTE